MISKSDLMREYGAMQSRITEGIRGLREEKKAALKRDIAALRQEQKTLFALRLNQARDEGMKRADLLEVLNTQRGDVLKEYVELGGGSMRRVKTAEERIQEAEEASQATLDAMHENLGVMYNGFIPPFDDQPEREYHCFTITETGDAFYLHNGKAWPYGDNQAEVVEWGRDHSDTIKKLSEHYETGE